MNQVELAAGARCAGLPAGKVGGDGGAIGQAARQLADGKGTQLRRGSGAFARPDAARLGGEGKGLLNWLGPIYDSRDEPKSQRTRFGPGRQTGTKLLGDFRIFTVRSDRKVSPRTEAEHDFFVIDCANWVNVIAVTPEQQLVMVEQYRHGSNTVELEIPGGMIDRRVAGGGRRARTARGNRLRGRAGRACSARFPEPGHHEQHLLHGAGGELPLRSPRRV